MFGEGPDQPPQFRRVDHLIDHQHFEQAGTWQRTAARFIRIAIKDRLQVNALQSREQQRDDGDRLDHTKPHSGLIPHLSLPDREKVCIAATSSVKFFNKLYLYQCHTYGTGLLNIKPLTNRVRVENSAATNREPKQSNMTFAEDTSAECRLRCKPLSACSQQVAHAVPKPASGAAHLNAL